MSRVETGGYFPTSKRQQLRRIDVEKVEDKGVIPNENEAPPSAEAVKQLAEELSRIKPNRYGLGSRQGSGRSLRKKR